MSRPEKRNIDPRLVVPIVGDGAIAGPVADGRLIPVLLIDTTGHPEVAELLRLHAHLKQGDASSQWGSSRTNANHVLLTAHFTRPMDVQVVLQFSIESQAILVEWMLKAGAVYLQTGKPGERLGATLRRQRILVELPDTGFRPYWDRLFLRRMTKVISRRAEISKKSAQPRAQQLLLQLQDAADFRLARSSSPRARRFGGGRQ